MAISDTSFYSNYQTFLGTSFTQGYEETFNPASTLYNFVQARALFVNGMSTTDTSNGITVINTHLASENTYNTAASNIVKNVNIAVNNFFNLTYGSPTRDYFNGLTAPRRVAWSNAYKASWQQAIGQELVQQIGFATWTGSGFVIYPANSPINNQQNTADVASINNNLVRISNYKNPITNFALPGDIIVPSSTGTLPTATNISLSTTVVGYSNTDTLLLSGTISGSATKLFAFRPLANTEYLEFRFGTSAATGGATAGFTSTVNFNVFLSTGVSTAFSISSSNAVGRINIGIYGNTTYKAIGITSMAITGGTAAGIGTIPAMEIWVKSTN